MYSIVSSGGGEGARTVAEAAKRATYQSSHFFEKILVAAAVTDNGRSTKITRERMGLPLGLGDLRNIGANLSDEKGDFDWATIFQLRAVIPDSDFNGMSVGNFVIAVLAKQYGLERTLKWFNELLLNNRVEVHPISLESVHIMANLVDRTTRFGEVEVRAPDKPRIRTLSLDKPDAPINPIVEKAIMEADLVTLGPGSTMSSVGANLLFMRRVLSETKALVVYLANTTDQIGQTDGWTTLDHVEFIREIAGEGNIDVVLANNLIPEEEVLDRLDREGRRFLTLTDDDRLGIQRLGIEVIEAPLIEDGGMDRTGQMDMWGKDDTIRHDPDKLSLSLRDLVLSAGRK